MCIRDRYNAKKIIEKENGNIKILSTLKKETEVQIRLPLSKATFLFNGGGPYENVLIEDYKLTQLIWHEEAIKKNKNLAIFQSPAEFMQNIDLVDKNAIIHIDSHFPDFDEPGELWSKKLISYGFKNLYLCSNSDIDISSMNWLKGKSNKNVPFQTLNI